MWFQHTAARRRLVQHAKLSNLRFNVSTHSRPKAAGSAALFAAPVSAVSTHSRPKAAGYVPHHPYQTGIGFNTQPPEGGWRKCGHTMNGWFRFQHTAARRRLAKLRRLDCQTLQVSTHSRPKAAGLVLASFALQKWVSTHSRPKAAGSTQYTAPSQNPNVSTHSRPKAAGTAQVQKRTEKIVSTHSRPKAAGSFGWILLIVYLGFNTQPPEGGWYL